MNPPDPRELNFDYYFQSEIYPPINNPYSGSPIQTAILPGINHSRWLLPHSPNHPHQLVNNNYTGHIVEDTKPLDCEVSLQNVSLWQKFHELGTEMIITKSGRRMFPSLRLKATNLEEGSLYTVMLEIVTISDSRYKYTGRRWIPAGVAEPQSESRLYVHPDSPAKGSHWMEQPIVFSKVKLTNNTLDRSGQIVLTSMHRYQPRIHLIKTSDTHMVSYRSRKVFTFPETGFMAVTAYQNDKITKLKIDNNPFAKGFRESGQSKCKRKLTVSESKGENTEEESENVIKRTPSRISTTGTSEDSFEGSTTISDTNTPEPHYTSDNLDDDQLTTTDSPTGSTGTTNSLSTLHHPHVPSIYNFHLYPYGQSLLMPSPLAYPYALPYPYFPTSPPGSSPYFLSHFSNNTNPIPEDLSYKSPPKKDFSIESLIGIS